MDCARTLMIEKNIAIKYWKEEITTIVHTLNRVYLKKESNQTPYELWYGYKPNISYLKVFGRKCYIFKESRKGKGYSYRSKAYKCLNVSTKKIIESTHVRIDEFAKKLKKKEKRRHKIAKICLL